MTRSRARWLHQRRAKGLKRPLPLAGIVVNCMSVSAGPERAKQVLRNAAAARVHGHPVDYLLFSEADDFDAHAVLGDDWSVHHDQTHPDRDGSGQALRRSRGLLDDRHLVLGSKALPGVLPPRWLSVAVAHVDPRTDHRWWFKSVSGHAPPMRAWVRWPAYLRALRGIRPDVAGADYNKLGRAVAQALGRFMVRAVHVLGVGVRRWIPVTPPVRVDVDGDHPAVGFVLWPNPKEN